MFARAPTYHTLSADTISKKMFDIVDEVNVVFQMPTPYVRLLLIACKWDKEKLLERCVLKPVSQLKCVATNITVGIMLGTRRLCLKRHMWSLHSGNYLSQTPSLKSE